ncbi:low affinity iron permease family protein [Sphingomonas antarctica]|uniref:low affinity iron permease family protein n=1 Tax=Sphingomonas antarctica TaxID=2040274 RepID=UPI0039EB7125
MLKRLDNLFRRIASRIANASGQPASFVLALVTVIVWAVSAPALNYSETCQLAINTGTTIVIFLMVFLIRNFADARYRIHAGESWRAALCSGRSARSSSASSI